MHGVRQARQTGRAIQPRVSGLGGQTRSRSVGVYAGHVLGRSVRQTRAGVHQAPGRVHKAPVRVPKAPLPCALGTLFGDFSCVSSTQSGVRRTARAVGGVLSGYCSPACSPPTMYPGHVPRGSQCGGTRRSIQRPGPDAITTHRKRMAGSLPSP